MEEEGVGSGDEDAVGVLVHRGDSTLERKEEQQKKKFQIWTKKMKKESSHFSFFRFPPNSFLLLLPY